VLKRFQIACAAIAGLLLWLPAASGQVQAGDLSMNLNGTLSAGYNGNYGNLADSAHNLNLGGSGTLTGSYFDPNFLNFNFSPYYNQSRSNSSFRSIFAASGFDFSSGIFNGSHFPGSVSYSKAYNSQGNFAVPGVADFTTRGNSDTLGITWSELLPDLPTLSVGFSKSSNEYNLFGTDQNGNNSGHSLNINSGYRIEGFTLGGYYTRAASQSEVPQVLEGAPEPLTSDSHSSGYGFSAGHALPLHGEWSSNFNSSSVNSDYLGYRYNGTVDTWSSTIGLQPMSKFHVQMSAGYSDNLDGLIYQSDVPPGNGILGYGQNQSSSHSMDLQSSASYAVLTNLQVQAYVDRRTQYFLGQDYGSTNYGGGVSYIRELLGGSLSSSIFLTENTLDDSDSTALGLNSSVGYNRRLGAWAFGGNFSYAQNAQTLLVSYTTSYYNYSGNVRRRFGSRLSWSATANGSRSGFTAIKGDTSSSQSYSTGVSFSQWIAASGSYSKSNGQALQFAGGLTPVPIPPVVPDNLLILYGGRSYSFSVSSSPIRGFTMAAAYAKTSSNTANNNIASWNNNAQWNTLFQYQFRKMYFTGGYSRLFQGFSASGTPPAVASSFYFGVSRWFNFF